MGSADGERAAGVRWLGVTDRARRALGRIFDAWDTRFGALPQTRGKATAVSAVFLLWQAALEAWRDGGPHSEAGDSRGSA